MAVSFEDILQANEVVKTSKYIARTPLVRVNEKMLGISDDNIQLFLKLENMQNAGSFKLRGVVHQLHKSPKEILNGEKTLITMSAGNYGRAFAYMCKELNLKGFVVLPDSAPSSRVDLIQSYGVSTKLVPTEEIQATVDGYVAGEGMVFLHPFDDLSLIAGYGSIGIELLNDLHDVDIVLVCCGGGGLLSGVSSAVKLSGKAKDGVKVIGVEPEGACTMYLSMKEGHAVTKGDAKSIAGGLAPPYAGTNAYQIVKQLVDDVVLVTDNELKECVKVFYNNGLVVEPSGAAGLAALRYGRIGDVSNKKIAIIVSGRNVVPSELESLMAV